MQGRTQGVADLLLVEDNPGDVRFIEEAFADSELEVTVHATASRDEALEYLHGRGEFEDAPEPDVVLLDRHLSPGPGSAVVAAAKGVDSAIPVVVMTGTRAEVRTATPSFPAADRIVEKQTDPEGYVELLRSLLAVP